jgi:hypothetical protein
MIGKMKYRIIHQDIFPNTLNDNIKVQFPTNTSKVTRVTKTTDGQYIIEWDVEPSLDVVNYVQSILEKRVVTKIVKE